MYSRVLGTNYAHSGKALTIKAHGNFTEKVEKGAYMMLEVKYGLIRLIKQRADLCDQMKNVDEECPLSGEKTITKDVDLPKEIPPVSSAFCATYPQYPNNGYQGKYTVKADVYTEADDNIVCLEATVNFRAT